MRKRIEVSPGEKFGRLTVIEEVKQRGKRRMFLCLCDCGVSREFMLQSLRSGHAGSCGCLSRELAAERNRTHGQTQSPMYDVWVNMMRRCYTRNNKHYSNYGGRGIEVCEKWRKFEGFFEDMAGGYRPGLTIERLNNNLGYSKTNCCWATRREQSRNTRRNRMIETPHGEMLLCEAVEVSGISHATLRERLERGWPTERLFDPVQVQVKGKKK